MTVEVCMVKFSPQVFKVLKITRNKKTEASASVDLLLSAALDLAGVGRRLKDLIAKMCSCLASKRANRDMNTKGHMADSF